MRGRRVCDILEEAAQFEGGVPLSRMIDLRRELTVLIKSELYGGGDKIEGRAALTARRELDGFFFHTNPLGATAAELDGLKKRSHSSKSGGSSGIVGKPQRQPMVR